MNNECLRKSLWKHLTPELRTYVLQYLDNIKIRKGECMFQIPRKDPRYSLLLKITPIGYLGTDMTMETSCYVNYTNQRYLFTLLVRPPFYRENRRIFIFYKKNEKEKDVFGNPVLICLHRFVY